MHVPVEDMTKRRNDLQQKLKHFPTDSLRAKVLKDTVVEGTYFIVRNGMTSALLLPAWFTEGTYVLASLFLSQVFMQQLYLHTSKKRYSIILFWLIPCIAKVLFRKYTTHHEKVISSLVYIHLCTHYPIPSQTHYVLLLMYIMCPQILVKAAQDEEKRQVGSLPLINDLIITSFSTAGVPAGGPPLCRNHGTDPEKGACPDPV